MFEEMNTIELTGRKYPIKCDLLVLEKIQDKYGTIGEFEQKLMTWEPVFMQNMMMIMGLVKKYQIPSQVNTRLLKIEPDGIVVQKENGEEKIPCDTVVLAMGFRPDDSVYEEIAGDYKTVKVGDCVSARKVYNAVHEAYDAVREL